MSSKKERHPHRRLLQEMADELETQQRLAVKISQDVNENMMATNTLDVENLLLANQRLVQAQTDTVWLTVLLRHESRTRKIIKMFKQKDEFNRGANGMHDNPSNPEEPSNGELV